MVFQKTFLTFSLFNPEDDDKNWWGNVALNRSMVHLNVAGFVNEDMTVDAHTTRF